MVVLTIWTKYIPVSKTFDTEKETVAYLLILQNILLNLFKKKTTYMYYCNYYKWRRQSGVYEVVIPVL